MATRARAPAALARPASFAPRARASGVWTRVGPARRPVRTRPRRTITITTESTDPRGRAFALCSARVLVANVSGSEPDPDSDPDPTATKRTLDRLEAEAIRRERERLYPPPPDIRGGGALLRVVAFALALWCHALAPLGGRWGAVPSGADPSFAAFAALRGSPLQWFGVSFLVSAVASGAWLRVLRAAVAHQPIREDGPASHAQGVKTKTPTMGGAAFVPAGCACALAFTGFADATAWSATAATLAFAGIGFVDDVGKLRGGRNDAGLTPGKKFAAQCAVAVAYCAWLALVASRHEPIPTTVYLVGGWSIPMGRWFWALSAFAAVAESNAVNVTDGLDGLAASTAAIALVAMGVCALSGGRAELAAFAVCVGGAAAGFLVVNRHPASCFMGDTGSLALGGALGVVAAAAGGWATLPLLVTTGVFVLETLSVMAQVGWFKFPRATGGEGRRLFRMAPLHHHLELGGWSEIKVVSVLTALGGVFALMGVVAMRLA